MLPIKREGQLIIKLMIWLHLFSAAEGAMSALSEVGKAASAKDFVCGLTFCDFTFLELWRCA